MEENRASRPAAEGPCAVPFGPVATSAGWSHAVGTSVGATAPLRPDALAQLVEDEGKQDHGTQGDVLRVTFHVGEIHDVIEDADQERADERAGDGARAPEQARSADDDGGDHGQLETVSRLRRARRSEE